MSDPLKKLDTPRVVSISHLYNCARCGMEHEMLSFKKFVIPVQEACLGDVTIWTHWTICPQTGDPILLQALPDTQKFEGGNDSDIPF